MRISSFKNNSREGDSTSFLSKTLQLWLNESSNPTPSSALCAWLRQAGTFSGLAFRMMQHLQWRLIQNKTANGDSLWWAFCITVVVRVVASGTGRGSLSNISVLYVILYFRHYSCALSLWNRWKNEIKNMGEELIWRTQENKEKKLRTLRDRLEGRFVRMLSQCCIADNSWLQCSSRMAVR